MVICCGRVLARPPVARRPCWNSPGSLSSDEERPLLNRVQEKFSIFWFSLQAIGQYALLLLAFRFLLPGVWAKQFAAGWSAPLVAFLATAGG